MSETCAMMVHEKAYRDWGFRPAAAVATFGLRAKNSVSVGSCIAFERGRFALGRRPVQFRADLGSFWSGLNRGAQKIKLALCGMDD